jgi:hypothetical protein
MRLTLHRSWHRRGRRAKTDRIEGKNLVRTLTSPLTKSGLADSV